MGNHHSSVSPGSAAADPRPTPAAVDTHSADEKTIQALAESVKALQSKFNSFQHERSDSVANQVAAVISQDNFSNTSIGQALSQN